MHSLTSDTSRLCIHTRLNFVGVKCQVFSMSPSHFWVTYCL
ncbi:unnamed protein product [Acanthoscelides obtectus]|uniref:Uncharacterized protein n=1 Tax=Acanthoscelides obtectus TaxID=200917 RepID=A0A9P0PFH2_ACAOB|nr:unnamed protein product [Acanthoscelides obtectus]CAK1643205.1 hypothetical protein AOBTE_LOCUS13445 [Acanthoscelides obtectus]